jgi:hypothetical protein
VPSIVVATLNVPPVVFTTKYTCPTVKPVGNAPVEVKVIVVPSGNENPEGSVICPGAAILIVT